MRPNRPISALGNAVLALLATSLVAAKGVQLDYGGWDAKRGAYIEVSTDLRTKVLGGEARIQRLWTGTAWLLNPLWMPLRVSYFTYSDANGASQTDVDFINRGDNTMFLPKELQECTPGGGCIRTPSRTVFTTKDDLETITVTSTGFTWEDHFGYRSFYDADGCMVRTENRSEVGLNFLYETITGTVSTAMLGSGCVRSERGTMARLTTITDQLGSTVYTFTYGGNNDTVDSVTDYSGRRIRYSYSEGLLTTVNDARGFNWTFTYNAQGRLTGKADPESRTLTLTYGANGKLSKVTDQDGQAVELSSSYVGGSSNLTLLKHRYSDGKLVEYYIDRNNVPNRLDINNFTVFKAAATGENSGNGYKYSRTEFNGSVSTVEYDRDKQPTKIIFADGGSLAQSYDPVFNNLVSQSLPNGTNNRFQYDEKGRLVQVTEAYQSPHRRTTSYTLDEFGYVTSERRPGSVGSEPIITYIYDRAGNLTTKRDAEGGEVRYTHNAQGLPLTVVDARMRTWTMTYDEVGNVTSVRDPRGRTVTMTYSRVGNLLSLTDADAKQTLYEYDNNYKVTKVTDREGAVTRAEYDPRGVLKKVIDAEGRPTTYAHDAFGRLSKWTDGVGNVTEWQYAVGSEAGGASFFQPVKTLFPSYQSLSQFDRMGRLVRASSLIPGGDAAVSSYQWDTAGHPLSVTDPDGKRREFAFDGVDNLTGIRLGAAMDVFLAYDARGNLTAFTDASGHRTEYTYDRNDRLLTIRKPGGQTTTFAYTGTGALAARTDARGQRIAYEYDDVGLLVGEDWFEEGATTPARSISYEYDNRGNLVRWATGALSAIFTWDAVGRKLSQTIDYGPFTATSAYAYDGSGLLVRRTGPDGLSYDYGHDLAGRLTSITLPGLGTISGEYNWRAPVKLRFPGGLVTTLTRNALLFPEDLTVTDPGTNVVLTQQYVRAKNQYVVSKVDGDATTTYRYDDTQRLVGVTPNTNGFEEQLVYDSVGNLRGRGTGEVPLTTTYDDNDQLLQSGATVYTYDDNGNVASVREGAVGFDYVYDVADHLVAVKTQAGATVAAYGYDPYDRRLWKTVEGVTTYYFYEDEGLTAELNGTGGVTVAYGFGFDFPYRESPLFLRKDSRYYFIHHDQVGAAVLITGANGAVVWKAVYGINGQATIASGATLESNIRLPGQYFDEETGFHYNFRRYYDPKSGRYLTPDPIGTAGGSNLYTYANNNPVNFFDPTGEAGDGPSSSPPPVAPAPSIPGIPDEVKAAAAAAKDVIKQAFHKDCINLCQAVGAGIDGLIAGWTGKVNKALAQLGQPPLPKMTDILAVFCSSITQSTFESFPAGTLVQTSQGLRAIETIKVGDLVLGRTEWDDVETMSPVTELRRKKAGLEVVELTLATGEVLTATGGHPFFHAKNGWTEAATLKVGDLLSTAGNKTTAVIAIKFDKRELVVYDLTVHRHHNFFIGKTSVLVHNSNGSGLERRRLRPYTSDQFDVAPSLTRRAPFRRVVREYGFSSGQQLPQYTQFESDDLSEPNRVLFQFLNGVSP